MIQWFEVSTFDEIIDLFRKLDCNADDEKKKTRIIEQLTYSWVYSFWSIQVDGYIRFKDEQLFYRNVLLSHLF